MLNEDVLNIISQFSSNKDILSFLSTCKLYHSYKGVCFYENVVIWGELPPVSDRIKNVTIRNIKNLIPKNVTDLSFVLVDQSLEGLIPEGVNRINFGCRFNKPVRNTFPKSVRYISFGPAFNQPIKDCIPNFVVGIKFGHYFNQKIERVFPESLKYLSFGFFFNQSLKDGIPNSVTHLKFGKLFNQPIEGFLPPSLVYLKLGSDFSQDLSCLPKSVTHLDVSWVKNMKALASIPNTITHLAWGKTSEPEKFIPNSVTHLKIPDYVLVNIKNFPENIKSLEIVTNHFVEVCIPKSITRLKISGYFLPEKIPKKVTHLEFGKLFRADVQNFIPKTVKVLKFNQGFDCQDPSETFQLYLNERKQKDGQFIILPKDPESPYY